MKLDPPPRVLVMSTHESGSYEEPALAAGAIAFIPKSQFSMDVLEESWAAAIEGER
jgi:DNA-binding NarL/FixJ family response regulator